MIITMRVTYQECDFEGQGQGDGRMRNVDNGRRAVMVILLSCLTRFEPSYQMPEV